MPKLLHSCVVALLGCSPAFTAAAADAPPWPPSLPRYDHIVIVVEENKDYDQNIGSQSAPYLNKLAVEGANFPRMFAEEHNSEGNYLWLFSGSNQNEQPWPATDHQRPPLKGIPSLCRRSVLRSMPPRQVATTPAFTAASMFPG
jgi:hypothetical protein